MSSAAALSVTCSDSVACRALGDVLAPDNGRTPRGMSLEMSASGRELEVRVASGSASVALSTVLAVLKDVILFQEVWLLSTAGETSKHGRAR